MVSRIQCNKLQFRDTHLVETNHDELEDYVGGLYSSAADLVIDLRNQNSVLIENLDDSADCENQHVINANQKSIKVLPNALETNKITGRLPNINAKEATNEEREEELTAEIWRPPTPPKVSPKPTEGSNGFSENILKDTPNVTDNIMTEKSPSKTPSPPQLSSVDMSLWRTQHITESTVANQTSGKLSEEEESKFQPNKNSLNETFDLPICASEFLNESVNSHKREHVIDTIQDDETPMILDPCASERNVELSSVLEMNVNPPKSHRSNFYDTTIILEESNLKYIVGELLQESDESRHVLAAVQQSMSITVGNEKPIKNNSNIPSVTMKSPSLNSPLSNNLNNSNNMPINQYKESKHLSSDRRVTFTLSNGDTQTNSPNVAVVPPNTRRETQNGFRQCGEFGSSRN